MNQMAIAIVNYNTRDALDTCLESVVREGAGEVLVVDNGSTDGSVEMVRSRYPHVRVEVDPTNPGYGAAANRAMALTKEPYLLVLNSDTVLVPGSVEALARHLDTHPGVAIVGPRTHNADGSLQPSCFPFPHPLRTLAGGIGVESLIRRVPGVRSMNVRTWAHDAVRPVPWVLGAALALRRSAVEELGGFSEDYFMYMEETDLCYRAHLAGWETHFTPAATIVHTGGVSTEQMRVQMRLQYYRSLIRFHARHGSRARVHMIKGVLRGGAMVKLLRDRIRLLATSEAGKRKRLEQDVEAWGQVVRRGWAAVEDAGVKRSV